MKKTLYIIRDIAITVGIQLVCFMVCLWIQNSTVENALIPAVSIFGVFLTSVITPGYLYGVAAAILSVLEVNFAFTFPFFHFNFSIPENMASAVIIILMALITCGFTTKIKYNKILEAERKKKKSVQTYSVRFPMIFGLRLPRSMAPARRCLIRIMILRRNSGQRCCRTSSRMHSGFSGWLRTCFRSH